MVVWDVGVGWWCGMVVWDGGMGWWKVVWAGGGTVVWNDGME